MTGHGGNVYRFSESSGIPLRGVTDFSASINPLGVPLSVKSAIKENMDLLFNYPDPDALRLRSEIAGRLDADIKSIICANGSTELIYLIPRVLKPGRVLIPAPTFSEYERACKGSNELRVASYELKRKNNFDMDPDEFIKVLAGEKKPSPAAYHSSLPFDMAFICNPNNPTGRLVERDKIIKIADAARELKCYLVVDEAFIDFVPEASVYKAVEKNPYLIILRSMTKIFALSGLRIGYGIFPLNLAALLNKHREPWTINTLAQEAGVAAINDREYLRKTLLTVRREKGFIEEGLKKLGLDFIPSAANYYLIKVDDSEKTVRSLKGKGLLVRDCSNFRGLGRSYIRVAVKGRRDNTKLLKELSYSCAA